MDEITAMRQAFTEPAPSAAATDVGRTRLLDLTRGHPATGTRPVTVTGRVPDRRRTRIPRWPVGLGLGLAATATAAALTIVVAGVPGGSSPSAPPSVSPARQVLLAAATNSLAASPGAGRFTRITVESGGLLKVGTRKHPYWVVDRSVDDRWYPNAAGVVGWYVGQSLGARPATAADEAAWRAAGRPASWRELCVPGMVYRDAPDARGVVPAPGATAGRREKAVPCRTARSAPGRREVERMDGPLAGFLRPHDGLDVTKLSGDPATLKRQLLAWTRSGGLAGPVEGDTAQLWAAVGTVLFEPAGPVTAKVRAACYRILADLPGVRSLGAATDPAGRRGVALSRTGTGADGTSGTDRIIVDPRTGFPLADEEFDPEDAGRASYTMVLRAERTDAAPSPAGRH